LLGGHSDARSILENSKKGPPSEDQRWAEVISEATQHVRTDGSDVRELSTPTIFRKVFLGALIGASAALLTGHLAKPAPASLSVMNQAADLRIEAALLVRQIHAYWEERGKLPDPLVLTPYLEEGYEYQIVDQSQGRFVVRRAAAGVTVTFDGSLPLSLWVLLGGQSIGESR